jgi:AcrR family transcriptional regulator
VSRDAATAPAASGPTGAPGVPPDPASLPANQRDRRDRIVRAAIELLEEGEYDTVQIRDVAERAGVALGTLYRYFTSKEHLYAAALLEWASGFRPHSLPGKGDGDTDEARLRALMRRAIRAFERRPQMMRAEMVLENSNDPNARELFKEFAARNLVAMSEALRDLDPAEVTAVAETANSVMAGRLRQWALGRCTIRDVDRAVQRTIDLIFSPPPG